MRGLSLQQVTADLEEMMAARGLPRRTGATHGNLSRIERGLVQYNQTLLELLAVIYHTSASALLKAPPEDPDGEPLESMIEKIAPEDRAQVSDIVRTFVHKPKPDPEKALGELEQRKTG